MSKWGAYKGVHGVWCSTLSVLMLLHRQVEEAKIMARAEQGDKTAYIMAVLGVSVPVPLMNRI